MDNSHSAIDGTSSGIGSRFPAPILQTEFDEEPSQGVFTGYVALAMLALALVTPLLIWIVVATHSA